MLSQPFRKASAGDFPLDLVHVVLIFTAHTNVGVAAVTRKGSPGEEELPRGDAGPRGSSCRSEMAAAETLGAHPRRCFSGGAD